MKDRSSGDAVELDYSHGYYLELNPLRARFALIAAGLKPPEVTTACELGFGQGMSVNIHAAAAPTRWYGCDISPVQAAFARSLAAVGGGDAVLTDESFDRFCARSDLPDFDYVGIHGTWSWISDADRAVVVDFLRRKLNLGGVLYMSYAAMPGEAPSIPLRHLLAEHVAQMTAPGAGLAARIDAALDFAMELVATRPAYTELSPMTARRLHNMRSRTRAYLAHEYFTRHWTAMHFSEMADHLGVAKLSYACSARLLDDVAVLNLTPQQRALLAEIPDPELRESVQDFLTNKTFRRDYWVKGARRLSSFEQAKMLRAMSFVLCTARSQVPSSVEGVAGKASLQGAVYGPVLAALADQRPHLFEEIESAVAPAGVTLVQLVQAVTVLMGMGVVEVAQEQAAAREAKLRTDRLNMRLLRKARGDWDVHHLASPLTGGGVELDRIEQLFLLARAEGRPQALWPSFVLDLLLAQDHVIRREGRPLSPQEMRAEIERDCAVFCEERLPLLAALMVA